MSTKTTTLPPVSRRRLIQGAGLGAAAVAFPAVLTPRKTRAAQRLVIRDPGGPWETAMREAVYKPFTEATGVEVIGVAGAHDPLAIIKGMVETKTYEWDVFILGILTNKTLADQGFLEELNIGDDPNVQEIPENFKLPTMIGAYTYASVLAFRTDAYPSGKPQPTGGWKDVWDTEKFPGRRALRKAPMELLEQALLADGVDPKDLYPLDMDRAFKKLDEIKPHVSVWWTGGAQTSQMLSNGEVDMTSCWNGRA